MASLARSTKDGNWEVQGNDELGNEVSAPNGVLGFKVEQQHKAKVVRKGRKIIVGQERKKVRLVNGTV